MTLHRPCADYVAERDRFAGDIITAARAAGMRPGKEGSAVMWTQLAGALMAMGWRHIDGFGAGGSMDE